MPSELTGTPPSSVQTTSISGAFRVLVATDGSEHALSAAEFLIRLGLPTHPEIEVIAVQPDVPPGAPEVVRRAGERWAQQALDETAGVLERAGWHSRKIAAGGSAAEAILLQAAGYPEDEGRSLLVLGSRGLTGVSAFFLGSVARNVAKRAAHSVLIVRACPESISRIVVAVDGSHGAEAALSLCSSLRLAERLEVIVTHVVPRYDPFPGLAPDDPTGFRREVREERRRREAAGRTLLDAAAEPLRAPGRIVETALLEGDPASAIMDLASERGAQLIISGARGVSWLEGLLTGSVADRLMSSADCSVLVAR
jgi:nucleotide-binding universal stress UspA family protein